MMDIETAIFHEPVWAPGIGDLGKTIDKKTNNKFKSISMKFSGSLVDGKQGDLYISYKGVSFIVQGGYWKLLIPAGPLDENFQPVQAAQEPKTKKTADK